MSETPDDKLAWEVEINYRSCVVFAATAAKARYKAVKSYWDAYGRRRGEWPRASAKRVPFYDKSPLRNNPRQEAYSRDYVSSTL